MDCEALINEVHRRRPLWDITHPHHHHRGVLDKSWNEVSRSMKVSVRDARHKWKYLRDQYRKELRKCPKVRTSSSYEPTWPYYPLLHFLKDQIAPKEVDDSSSSQNTDDTQSQSYMVKIEAEDIHVSDEELQDDAQSRYAESRTFRPFKRSVSNNNTLNTKLAKLDDREESRQHEEVSDDYHFFMSLLPTMKKFNDLQKMRLRNKFQQAIVEELSQMEEYK